MKQLYLCSLLLLFSVPHFGQQKALLTDFRFIVNDTQEFPNFFDDETLTQIIFQKGINFISKKLKVDSIEQYQAKEVEYRFRPPFRENLKLINRDYHDYYISIISSAGINTSENGDKTYIVYSKVRIENEQNDTVFINRSKAVFTLSYDKSTLYDEAVITKSDFTQLFTTLLESTFFDETTPVISSEFTKPAIVAYNGFMKKAEKNTIRELNKLLSQQFVIQNKDSTVTKFMTIRSKPISLNGTIRIDNFADILKFDKEFLLKNKATKERFRIKGKYEEAIDYETKTRYIKSTRLEVRSRDINYTLEFFPNRENSWIYTLKWNIDEDNKYELAANRYTNFVEIFSNGGLIAIIQLPSSGIKLKTIMNKDFVFYYRTNLAENTKNNVDYLFAFFMMANQFMEEVGELRQR